MRRTTMILVLTLLLTMMLVACGGGAAPAEPPAVPTVAGLPAEPSTNAPEAYPPLEGGSEAAPTVDAYAAPYASATPIIDPYVAPESAAPEGTATPVP